MPTVTRVRVQNFRSCVDTTLRLGQHTPVVGYNNAGKSNLLDALTLSVSPAKLSPRDFNDLYSPVVIEATIIGVSDEVLDNLATAHRKKIEPFVSGAKLVLKRTWESPETTAAKVKTDLFSEDSGDWKVNPAGINNALKPLLPDPIRIRAMEDAYADAGKTGRTSLGQLIKELLQEFDDDLKERVQEALSVITEVFGVDSASRPESFHEADREMSKLLDAFMPGMSALLSVSPPTFDDLISKGATILLKEDGQDARGIDEYGHGTQRSAQMALLQLLASRQKHEGAIRPVLIIDEPELYLHPQAVQSVKAALASLSKGGYQVVFSTHTPEMVGRDSFHEAAVVTKRAHKTTVRPSVSEAVEIAVDAASRNEALFAFRNAAEILFSDRVIIVEGKDDKACILELYSMDRGQNLSQLGVGVVDLGGVRAAQKYWNVLEALRIPFLVVSDLDFAFRTGPDIIKGTSIETEHMSDISGCATEFSQMHKEGIPIDLDEHGLPTGKGEVKANKAFGLLARRENALPIIRRIHERLVGHGIWVWPCGALEQLLGDHGAKRKSIMRENAISAAATQGLDDALAEAAVLRELFDTIEDASAFTLGSSPEGNPSVAGIKFVSSEPAPA